MRRAFIGFCSSFVSDCVSNGMRVVKTYTQTSLTPIGYGEAAMRVVRADGVTKKPGFEALRRAMAIFAGGQC